MRMTLFLLSHMSTESVAVLNHFGVKKIKKNIEMGIMTTENRNFCMFSAQT